MDGFDEKLDVYTCFDCCKLFCYLYQGFLTKHFNPNYYYLFIFSVKICHSVWTLTIQIAKSSFNRKN